MYLLFKHLIYFHRLFVFKKFSVSMVVSCKWTNFLFHWIIDSISLYLIHVILLCHSLFISTFLDAHIPSLKHCLISLVRIFAPISPSHIRLIRQQRDNICRYIDSPRKQLHFMQNRALFKCKSRFWLFTELLSICNGYTYIFNYRTRMRAENDAVRTSYRYLSQVNAMETLPLNAKCG